MAREADLSIIDVSRKNQVDFLLRGGGRGTGGAGVPGANGRSIVPAGEWDVDTPYVSGSFVGHEGNSYTARVDDLGTEPGTDDAIWQLSAEKGETGATGGDGQDGQDGAAGAGFEFDVRNAPYSAVPDDPSDQTTNIQAAIDAAGAYTDANPGQYGRVYIPEGTFIVGQLNIDKSRVILSNSGRLQFADDNESSDNMVDVKPEADYVRITGGGIFDCAGQGNPSVGNGIRLQGYGGIVDFVRVENCLRQGILALDASDQTTIRDVEVANCPLCLRVRGDHVRVADSKFLDFTGEKGVTVDCSSADAQYFEMRNSYFRTDAQGWEAMMLIDPGDGVIEETGQIPCGTLSNWNGHAKYLIQGGHGFKVGDGFWVFTSGYATSSSTHSVTTGAKTFVTQAGKAYQAGAIIRITNEASGDYLTATVTSYSGTSLVVNVTAVFGDGVGLSSWVVSSPAWDINHRIIGCGGDLFVRVKSTTTLELYDTAAHAIDATDLDTTGRIALVTTGTTGTDFFLTTPRGGRHAVSPGTGVNISTDLLTTDDEHGFETGEAVRATPGNLLDELPQGIQTYGWVILSSTYAACIAAGANGITATYMRPKRIEKVVLDGNIFEAPNASLNAGCLVKCHNYNNLIIDGRLTNSIDDSYNLGVDDIQSLRLGGNGRKVFLRNLDMSDGLFVQAYTNIARFMAVQCNFGDGYNITNRPPITGFCAQHAIFQQCTMRTGSYVIEMDYRDDDIDYWEFDDCEMQGFGTARTSILRDAGNYGNQLRTGGKIFIKPNCRWYNLDFPGLAIGTVSTGQDSIRVTNHGLRTGDEVYFTAVTMPTNLAANTPYWVRVLNYRDLKFYSTRFAAMSNGTPIDLTDSGDTVVLNSVDGKMGMQMHSTLTAAGFLFRCLNSPMEVYAEDLDNLKNTGINVPLGFRVWKDLPAASAAPGWVCVTAGNAASLTAAAFVAMPALQATE